MDIHSLTESLTEGVFGRQARRLMKLNTGLPVDQEVVLNAFTGQESLANLYEFNLELLSQNARIELKSLLLQQFQIEIETPYGEPRYISGYVTHAESVGADEGMARYRATLHPWLWFLTCRSNYRIFQDKTVDGIIEEIFSEYSPQAIYEFRLSSELPELSYCTQFNETDYKFVQRLIERNGLFYWFEQGEEGHKMVIADSSIELEQLSQQPSIRFHRAQVTEESDSITQWFSSRTYQPSKVSLKTYDYKQPGHPASVSAKTVLNQGAGGGELELYDYPGGYEFNGFDEGESLAKQHMEMLEVNAKAFRGAGNVRALELARWFQLEGHYDHEYDAPDDRQFLITSISHSGRNNYLQEYHQEAYYQNEFTCIRRYIPYRAPYSASRPRAGGPQTATVVGPEGEEIFTDTMGRIKVQFPWDRYGAGNDQSSCWIRTSTMGAGSGHGYVRIPRVGEEVLVEFLDGNPDRPIVTGTVYNGANPVPWGLPDQRNVSGFMSRSTKGGTADNASWLQFDDTLGRERVHLHAERNLNISVEADEQHQVDGSEYEDIKKDKAVQLAEGNYTLNVAQGKVAIVAAQEISLQAGASKITMTKDGDIQVDATSFKVNASSIDLA